MNFDPSVTLKNRMNEAIKDGEKAWTSGRLAILGLDNMAGKGEHKQLVRQFRIGTQILDAEERGQVVEMPEDDFEIVKEVVRDVCTRLANGVLLYGRFCEAIEAMKEAGKGKRNGAEADEARAG